MPDIQLSAFMNTNNIMFIEIFYYTLGNLRPELRSTQRSIQLIACITSPVLAKDGFEAILRPFVDDVSILVTVRKMFQMHNGVTLYMSALLYRLG